MILYLSLDEETKKKFQHVVFRSRTECDDKCCRVIPYLDFKADSQFSKLRRADCQRDSAVALNMLCS